ncbi:MAG: hypothetical protein ACJAQ4_001531 [Cryomorphaceae bacterium]|jgi:hypothetical protein
MKPKLRRILISFTLISIPTITAAQTPPPLGVAADFVLFTTTGAVTNEGISNVTGDVGTNAGAFVGFGNINGSAHIVDEVSAQAAIDLNTAYSHINAQGPDSAIGILLGSDQVLSPNIYLAPGAATLTGTLTLDGGNDPNACFVIKINGAFSTAAGSKVILTNGAKACNVFWRVNGQMSMATNSIFKGSVITAGAIPLGVGVHLEGRALSITGAITASSLTANISLGCGEPILSGPTDPILGDSIDYFGIFTATGAVSNTGTTDVHSNVGSDNGAVSGFDPAFVNDTIHSIPDAITAQAALDLDALYADLNSMPVNIELLSPTTFGNSLVLTPHVYLLSAATMLTDTLFLDARCVSSAVFVIRINGALTTNGNPQVVLLGGAEAKNIFWQVEGAVTISGAGNFKGTIVANNSSITLASGVILEGRAFSTAGTITTADVNIARKSFVTGPTANLTTASKTVCHGEEVTLRGNITATCDWTLTLSNGQTTTGSGNGAWKIVVLPTSTTTFTISSIVDASAVTGMPSGAATLTLPSYNAGVAINNDVATCSVNQAGWVHYYHSSGRLLASINSAGQNLGTVSVTTYLDSAVQIVPDCFNLSAFYETAVMQRHWVITPTIQPTMPVQVRLLFSDAEYDNLVNKANSNSNISDDISRIEDIKLTKYSGPLNVNASATDNCVLNGGTGGGTLHSQDSNGRTSAYSLITNSSYIDFSVSEFSEFWLHASSANSSLPIKLISFTAAVKDAFVELNWSTATENNNDYFNVERSADGINFNSIGRVDGAGNSSQTLNYEIVDDTPLNGVSYYRLRQTDYDGKNSYSELEAVEFDSRNGFNFKIYPNPNNGERFSIDINENNYILLVVMYDILGKELYSEVIFTTDSHKYVYAIEPSQKLKPGVYLVAVTSNNGTHKKRLIVK